jgi:hypothetical protein
MTNTVVYLDQDPLEPTEPHKSAWRIKREAEQAERAEPERQRKPSRATFPGMRRQSGELLVQIRSPP